MAASKWQAEESKERESQGKCSSRPQVLREEQPGHVVGRTTYDQMVSTSFVGRCEEKGFIRYTLSQRKRVLR